MTDFLNHLCMEMIDYDRRDPKRIQHLIKVHGFAKLIGEWEGLDGHSLFILEAAAYLLDIGAHRAEIQFGRTDRKTLAAVGPEEAAKLLANLGMDPEDIDEVSYLIAAVHEGRQPDGEVQQILKEADILVRLYEESVSQNALKAIYAKAFRTVTGSKICREMFLDDRDMAYKEWMEHKFDPEHKE